MPSFTSRVPNLAVTGPVVELRVAAPAGLEAALAKRGIPVPPAVAAVGMIDTGASDTVIQQGIAGRLGLQPVGVTHITTPSSANVRCLVSRVRLLFAASKVVVNTTAIEAPLQGQNIQCLIGRNVLAHGVLIYIGYDNSFSLGF